MIDATGGYRRDVFCEDQVSQRQRHTKTPLARARLPGLVRCCMQRLIMWSLIFSDWATGGNVAAS